MKTKPKTRKAPAANGAELDPILAVIDAHKTLRKEWHRLNKKLDNAGAQLDQRAGVAPLREQFERADAGLERVYGGFEGWEIHALRTAATALTRIGAEAS